MFLMQVLLGSLMYAMVYTRLYLAQAFNVMSRYMGNLRKEHWKVVKRIFNYLQGTIDIGLIYHRDTSCVLFGYLVANYSIYLDAK